MQIINGKYNSANVMIDTIDDITKVQIKGFLNNPAFVDSYIAIMPDCHVGKGAVIGFTMKLNQYVIPNIIGVDIGCGMLMARFSVKDVDFPMLDKAIKNTIPSGFSINQKSSTATEITRDVNNVCNMIGINGEKALRGIGSLGGGNHFIEAGFDKDHFLVVTIHSGSRNFGKCVAEFYQKKAREGFKGDINRSEYKDLEFMAIDSSQGRDYLYSMKVAQGFASANRKEMMDRISLYLGQDPLEFIESVHNFIGEDNIIRKGATPARLGEKVLIPFNMADGIALCVGKGSSLYNNSAPHGAGRILSRTQAKRILRVEDFSHQMKAAGVYTTTANADTLDEAPGAYKPMDLIMENIKDTVDVVELIKPAYNFKAGGD